MQIAVAMIWRWMFNSDYGIINYILNIFGMDSVQFLSNPQLAWIAICIVIAGMKYTTQKKDLPLIFIFKNTARSKDKIITDGTITRTYLMVLNSACHIVES